MMRSAVQLFAFLLGTCTLLSCSTAADQAVSALGAKAASAEELFDGSVGELIRTDERFSLFSSLILDSGMAALMLERPMPLTVLAPTNDAIERMGAQWLQDVKGNKDALAAFVMLHCVEGTEFDSGYDRQDNLIVDSTIQGLHLTISFGMANLAWVSVGTEPNGNRVPMHRNSDREADNGNVIAIDGVLDINDAHNLGLPRHEGALSSALHVSVAGEDKDGTMWDLMSQDTYYNAFAQIIQVADLVELFSDRTKRLTVLAPSNVALSYTYPNWKEMFEEILGDKERARALVLLHTFDDSEYAGKSLVAFDAYTPYAPKHVKSLLPGAELAVSITFGKTQKFPNRHARVHRNQVHVIRVSGTHTITLGLHGGRQTANGVVAPTDGFLDLPQDGNTHASDGSVSSVLSVGASFESVWQLIEQDKYYTVFARMIRLAGLVELFADPTKQLTVLAPSDISLSFVEGWKERVDAILSDKERATRLVLLHTFDDSEYAGKSLDEAFDRFFVSKPKRLASLLPGAELDICIDWGNTKKWPGKHPRVYRDVVKVTRVSGTHTITLSKYTGRQTANGVVAPADSFLDLPGDGGSTRLRGSAVQLIAA